MQISPSFVIWRSNGAPGGADAGDGRGFFPKFDPCSNFVFSCFYLLLAVCRMGQRSITQIEREYTHRQRRGKEGEKAKKAAGEGDVVDVQGRRTAIATSASTINAEPLWGAGREPSPAAWNSLAALIKVESDFIKKALQRLKPL
ncbi:uncharacterized protein LOC111251838 [Varroa destructor]|uniref:Uncharacterized protein n=1 Tax=Varroa destructor TaxID=109461 RepID=A0A7M7KBX1_VARDE|nr:uncharacterized protein LOC111251838 [Varroa destructor]